MARDQDIFERTVREAVRRCELLFGKKVGNASTSSPGNVPPSPGDATQFLNGASTPAFAQVKGSDLSMADVTTNNVSTTKHGFAPKAPNDATKFLDGTGAYSTPAGGGSGLPTLGSFPSITGLVLRLSAELSTITQTTDNRVTQINDLSGAWGSNFTASGTARPRYVPRGMGYVGRPALAFNGSTTQLVAGATKTLAQPFTFVAVVQNWNNGGGNQTLFRDTAAGPCLFITAGAWAMFAGATQSNGTLLTQNREDLPDGMVGAPAVAMGVFNGAGASILANNGVEIGSLSPGAGGVSGTMQVGAETTGEAHMLLYELLIFSKALSPTERAQINAYYANALTIQM